MAKNTTGFLFSNDPSSPSSDVNAENLNNAIEYATIRNIGTNAIKSIHLDEEIAGAGLGGTGSSPLYVKTDGQSVEIDNDFIRVKEAGIKTKHLENGSVTVDKLAGDIQKQFNDILRSIYCVGDFFITRNATFNPASRFGGQWELLKDKFLIGAGGEYILGSTGGEKEHTLTINEMPSHNHTMINLVKRAMANSNHASYCSLGTSETDPNDTTSNKSNRNMARIGNDKPHNNMPPYQAVNIWVKISDEDAQ